MREALLEPRGGEVDNNSTTEQYEQHERLMKAREAMKRAEKSNADWLARQAVFQADEARAGRYSNYPIGSDSFGARAERATFTAMKVVFVMIPVAAVLLWLIWSVVTG